MGRLSDLFKQTVQVVNVGIPSFADDLKKQNVSVIHVDWRPPAGGNKRIADLLEKVRKSQARFQK